jgi:hypothetical protein
VRLKFGYFSSVPPRSAVKVHSGFERDVKDARQFCELRVTEYYKKLILWKKAGTAPFAAQTFRDSGQA